MDGSNDRPVVLTPAELIALDEIESGLDEVREAPRRPPPQEPDPPPRGRLVGALLLVVAGVGLLVAGILLAASALILAGASLAVVPAPVLACALPAPGRYRSVRRDERPAR